MRAIHGARHGMSQLLPVGFYFCFRHARAIGAVQVGLSLLVNAPDFCGLAASANTKTCHSAMFLMLLQATDNSDKVPPNIQQFIRNYSLVMTFLQLFIIVLLVLSLILFGCKV